MLLLLKCKQWPSKCHLLASGHTVVRVQPYASLPLPLPQHTWGLLQTLGLLCSMEHLFDGKEEFFLFSKKINTSGFRGYSTIVVFIIREWAIHNNNNNINCTNDN